MVLSWLCHGVQWRWKELGTLWKPLTGHCYNKLMTVFFIALGFIPKLSPTAIKDSFLPILLKNQHCLGWEGAYSKIFNSKGTGSRLLLLEIFICRNCSSVGCLKWLVCNSTIGFGSIKSYVTLLSSFSIAVISGLRTLMKLKVSTFFLFERTLACYHCIKLS